MKTGFQLPRLYPIVDVSCFAAEKDPLTAIVNYAQELVAGGATLLQYRNKFVSDWRGMNAPSPSGKGAAPAFGVRQALSQCRELRRALGNVTLIMNDRADLCIAAGFDGVHLGQDDLSPTSARMVIGDHLVAGFSTHNPEQVSEADTMPLDYVAVGPVFATTSKANPDPVIGLDGVCVARSLTKKPLVAIGGITRANCRAVIDAGADSVAVIGDLLVEPRRAVEEFLALMA